MKGCSVMRQCCMRKNSRKNLVNLNKYKIVFISSLLFFVVSISKYFYTQSLSNGKAFIKEEASESTHISAVCQTVKNMDFAIKEPQMDITENEDKLYKEVYLKVLKNEMPLLGVEKEYYRDLWKAGISFEELLEKKDEDCFPYLLYYDDLDGDGKPELGVNQGCLYLFDYELGDDGAHVLYCQESCYFEGILGAGQIWYHDGLHANVIRDRYVYLNRDNEWEEWALDLEQAVGSAQNYYLVGTTLYQQIDVGEENWNEITAPFFEMTKYEIPKKTFWDVFGELL